MKYFQKFLPVTLIIATVTFITTPSFGMEPDELLKSPPSQKLKSVIATKGEIEELTFKDMTKLIEGGKI